MPKFNLTCTITEEHALISGLVHRKVLRGDGFALFLDEAFLYALHNLDNPSLADDLGALFEVRTTEVQLILESLQKAGLIQADSA